MAFPTTLDDFTNVVDDDDDVMANDINELQEAIEALEAKVGIDSSAVVTSLDYKVNKFFVSDRAVYIYQDDADIPDGWSKVAVTDKVLAVKGGTNVYNVSGGNTAGTFTISTANMPAHAHPYGWNPGAGFERQSPGRPVMGGNTTYGSWSDNTDSTGGGDGKYRPTACVGIIIAMD